MPPRKTKKDRHKQGAHNLPPECPAEAIASANGGSTTSGGGDFREREGRGGKPPDSSVVSGSLQAVMNDVKLDGEEELNPPTDDDWDGVIEDYTVEQLGNPNDPGPVAGVLGAVTPTTLGITGDGGTLDGEIEA